MQLIPTHRFLRPTALAWGLALSLCACGGGGGGSSVEQVPPVLVAASFSGAGVQPSQGDTLRLTFSEPVRLSAGAFLDADCQWIVSGSLGSNPTALVQTADARQVLVTLGAGVTFTVNQTQLDVATTANVLDLVGNRATPSDPVVIRRTDGTPPQIGNLTVNAIDGLLNGTGPAGGTLMVPQNGWYLDLAYSDTGLGIDPAATRLLANIRVADGSASLAPGQNLVAALTPISVTATSARFLVPTTTTFPDSLATITAIAVDLGGLASPSTTYSFYVRRWTDQRRPFETTANPSQLWFLDTSRDIETFSIRPIAGGISIDQVKDGNGRPIANGRTDYLDVLFVLGLQSTNPLANVIGSSDSNAVVRSLFESALLQQLAVLFQGVNIQFTLAQPSSSFQGNASYAYASFPYSTISVAGSSETSGVLGVAQLDPNNQAQNNNTLLEANGRARLGVFLHTMANFGLGPPSTSTFHFHFDPFVASLGGVAIGDDPSDRQRLVNTLNDTRASRIDLAIASFARFAAVVIAHECGHSMGLVVDGPPPTGLFGGDATNFSGSTSGHIRTRALFPTGSTNVMSPQLSYDLTLDANTRFNSLNFAYLREQVSYGN